MCVSRSTKLFHLFSFFDCTIQGFFGPKEMAVFVVSPGAQKSSLASFISSALPLARDMCVCNSENMQGEALEVYRYIITLRI